MISWLEITKAEMQRPKLKDHEEKLEEILPSLKLEIVMDR